MLRKADEVFTGAIHEGFSRGHFDATTGAESTETIYEDPANEWPAQEEETAPIGDQQGRAMSSSASNSSLTLRTYQVDVEQMRNTSKWEIT